MQESIKNPAKNYANFVWENKIQKNALEMDLGQSWASFGRRLGRSGASFGRSWPLLGHFGGVQISKSSRWKALVQNRPQTNKNAKVEAKSSRKSSREVVETDFGPQDNGFGGEEGDFGGQNGGGLFFMRPKKVTQRNAQGL